MEPIAIHYILRRPDSKELEFPLQFTAESFSLMITERDSWPEWTQLDVHTCPHCPFDIAQTAHCPLATSLVAIIESTSDLVSHHAVEAEVISLERRVTVATTAGDALRSLMGLIIPTSGCPKTAFFRPMARFHLPFSTSAETLYRVCAMHRLAQTLRAGAGLAADDAFDDLARIYADINVVNTQIALRLQDAAREDSSRSAVALLDVFAQLIPFQFDQILDELRGVFAAYLT